MSHMNSDIVESNIAIREAELMCPITHTWTESEVGRYLPLGSE